MLKPPDKSVPASPDDTLIQHFLKHKPDRMTFDADSIARALGTELVEVDVAKGRLRLEFEPGPDFIQGAGVLQGGAIAAMLDFAMTFVVMAHLGGMQTVATTSMNVMYLKPAPRGRYQGIREIERVGRSVAFARAQLSPVAGAAVASATSTLAILTSSRPDSCDADGCRRFPLLRPSDPTSRAGRRRSRS